MLTKAGYPKNAKVGDEFKKAGSLYVYVGPDEDDWQRFDLHESDWHKDYEELKRELKIRYSDPLVSKGSIVLSKTKELTQGLLNKIYKEIDSEDMTYNEFIGTLERQLDQYAPEDYEWVENNGDWILKVRNPDKFGDDITKAIKTFATKHKIPVNIHGMGLNTKAVLELPNNPVKISIERSLNYDAASVWFTSPETQSKQMKRFFNVADFSAFLETLTQKEDDMH